MVACSRSRAGACSGRAVGHGPEFLGTGWLFPGRASLAPACIGRQPEGSVSIQRAHALLAAAELSSAISDFEYGLQCARQAQELFQQLGDQRGEIDARLKYCDLAELAGELANLQAQAEEALQMAEQMSYTAGMAKARLVTGIQLPIMQARIEAAIQYVLPSVALWRELERPFELATALNRLASALLEIHEYAAASTGITRMPGYLSIARLPAWRRPGHSKPGRRRS